MSGGGGNAASAGAQGALEVVKLSEAIRAGDNAKIAASRQAFNMRMNAKMLEIQREEIYNQATKDADDRESQIKQMVGKQRASLAAQGIDVDSDVAVQIEAEERRVGMLDVEAIKNNAWREAMGLEVKQQDLMRGADVALQQGAENRRATLATGGLQAVSGGIKTYRGYKKWDS